MSCKNTQSGNVLFLILIAVALFGALSFAVTSTSRSSKDPGREKLELKVAEIIQYASQVEQGIRQIGIIERCDVTSYSFHMPGITALAAYEHGSELNKCRVFHSSGGAAPYDVPPIEVNDGTGYFFYGSACVPELGLGAGNCASDGVDNEELIMLLPNVTERTCRLINEKLKIIDRGDPIPQDQGDAYNTASPFTGSFSEVNAISDAGGVLKGQFTACFEGGGTPAAGTYHFYQVLKTR